MKTQHINYVKIYENIKKEIMAFNCVNYLPSLKQKYYNNNSFYGYQISAEVDLKKQ